MKYKNGSVENKCHSDTSIAHLLADYAAKNPSHQLSLWLCLVLMRWMVIGRWMRLGVIESPIVLCILALNEEVIFVY